MSEAVLHLIHCRLHPSLKLTGEQIINGLLPFNRHPTVTTPTITVSEPCPLSISEFCQPVSGIITQYKGGIKVSGSGEFEVKVYNVSGVMVKSIKGKNEVKLELSRGVYFVEVISGEKVIREKVVIR